MEYRYAGPHPVADPDSGEAIHPGDVREFDQEPGWGPWEKADRDNEPPAPEPPAPPAETAPEGAEGGM